MADQNHPSSQASPLALILSEMLKSALEWEMSTQIDPVDPEIEKRSKNDPSSIDYPPTDPQSAKVLGRK